jgi:4-hydroxybutyrate dehydrogenase/sulfolactaldehyde 3-reductase
VYDVDAAATERLVQAGAAAAESPAAVADVSDVVITMVPDAPDVEQAALGPCGILAGAHRGLIYIGMSTIDPVTTRRIGAAMATRGVRMIDCPVGRTTAHAEADGCFSCWAATRRTSRPPGPSSRAPQTL